MAMLSWTPVWLAILAPRGDGAVKGLGGPLSPLRPMLHPSSLRGASWGGGWLLLTAQAWPVGLGALGPGLPVSVRALAEGWL